MLNILTPGLLLDEFQMWIILDSPAGHLVTSMVQKQGKLLQARAVRSLDSPGRYVYLYR